MYEPLETFYEISHHKHKLVFLISAFRHFKKLLKHDNLIHVKIEKERSLSLINYLDSLHEKSPFSNLYVAKPSDFKTLKDLMYFCQSHEIKLKVFDVNLRSPFYSKPLIIKLLQQADIVKMNDEELKVIGNWLNLNNTEENIGVISLEENVRSTIFHLMSVEANARLYIREIREQFSREDLNTWQKATVGTRRFFAFDHFGSMGNDEIFS